MRVGIIQMNVVKGNRPANRQTVAERVDTLMRQPCPPQVIVLPELWSTGYALKQAAELATPEGEDEAAFLGELARKYHVAFAGSSVMALHEGRIFNRAQIVDENGRLVGSYDKIHLFGPMDEDTVFSPGREAVPFFLYGACCACIICYDLRFCELPLKLALEGAQVLFISAEWPLVRKDHWITLLRARAIENQLFVVGCNRSGGPEGRRCGGHSTIVAPDGTILAQADANDALLCGDLNLDLVRATREAIPAFKDRTLYGHALAGRN